MKQLFLFNMKSNIEFGGSLTGKRKSARPLNFKMAHHFVLKAADSFRLLSKKEEVESILKQFNKKFGVRMYSCAIHCDHIHINVRLTNRVLYRRWIRALTACLVMKIPGLKFRLRPYSRILSWGRQFHKVNRYIFFNKKEAEFILSAHDKMCAFLKRIRGDTSHIPAILKET